MSEVMLEQIITPPSAPEEEVTKLAESIQEQGLLHPITVRQENGKVRIVTGKVRYWAVKKLGRATIPVSWVTTGADKDKEIHIHENLKRQNLPWYDEVQLVKDLHELRQAQHGEAPRKGGRPKSGVEKEGWGLRDTAEELDRALGPLSEDIKLAYSVESDPSLRNIKDKKTAIRLVRMAARRAEAEVTAALPATGEKNQVFLGSSAEVLKHFPDNTFDACITDPPWIEFAAGEAHLRKDPETWPVFKEVFRVLKYDSWMYTFVGVDDFFWYREHLPTLGFRVWKIPLIWYKPGVFSRSGDESWRYARDYELILLAAKGKPATTFSVTKTAVFSVPPIPPASLIHPNEKPLPLIVQILEDSTYEGSMVLDPFAGSGVVARAAKLKKRHYIAVEREQKYYVKIRKDLQLDP